ncbi:intramembrane protease 2 [Pleomassaria siparia CBS 279.74]|uniref:Intramembrane protease 2 n=1 Tax=Pleomassaria siparia CBS 279.74 TaxID=1314801 RepID=A0A6G1KJU4_9PLEO|nr:intramembrane protease 2 [Pleomassaria siparia CBS 279.74]
MAEPSLFARILGEAAYEFSLIQPMIPTYIHLLASALFPIYVGAHASLSRPASAAKPTKKKKRRITKGGVLTDVDDDDEEEEDDDDEETHKMEGLSPTDAIMMPLLAGITLAGLYFLIKWMENPDLLNKILNAYFAIFGVFSVAKLITDALDIGHSIIFPRRYTLGGALYHVDQEEKKAKPVAGNIKDKKEISSPLPGFLARLPLSDHFHELLWSDRAMPGNKWTLRMYVHRVFAGKLSVGPHGLVGFVLSTAAVAYFNLVDKPWYLTNLMGFGFSYGALQLMSPTTFATGSLILGALFFYDIYFVFYTPMMVTVAKTLDVPIKLVFPRPAHPDSTSSEPSLAMLGLGDVVLPGIMIGLALRYDLYLFYLRRQKFAPAVEQGGDVAEEATVVKSKYFSLAGRWSDHFWTHSLTGRLLYATSDEKNPEPPFTFPKTYFKASVVGYLIGMLATLGVMHVWGHAQPALLYLVPGVLGSLWLTALAKGELSMMWDFSEAVEDDDDDESSRNKGDEKKERPAPERTSIFSLVVAAHKADREVFSFSIEAPWKLKHPRSIKGSSKDKKPDEKEEEEEEEEEESPLEKGKPNWAPPVGEEKVAEPCGKRIRLN